MSDLPDYAEIKQRDFIRTLTVAGGKYEAISSHCLQESGDLDLRGHIPSMKTAQCQHNRDHTAMLRSRLRQAKRRLQDQDDGIRNMIHAAVQLRGKGMQDERAEDNRRAIGGMRNPIKSLLRVPGHREVAALVAKELENYLDAHPQLE